MLLENYNECYHCGPVHPELSRLVPSFAGGGAGLDWDQGIPHRDGAWTFTLTGTTTRAPLPGLDEHERIRHKGDLAYPNLMLSASADHVAAFVLQPRAVDRTEVVCTLLFAPEAVADPAFDPSDAAELWDLVNQQDWAICESVQRGMTSRAYHARLVRADGGRQPRHPALAAAPPRSSAGGGPMSEQVDYVVVGLGGLGSATAWELARRGHRVLGLDRFALGHSHGASHDTSRILRHSYHTPAYVRLTQEAYADWARLEQESGESLVTRTGGLDLFPPDPAIPAIDYTQSMDEVGIAYEALDADRVMARWPQLRVPDGHAGAVPDRGGDRPGRPDHRGPAPAGTAARGRAARPHPGRSGRGPRCGRRASRPGRRRDRCRRRRRLRRRLDQRRARPLGLRVPLEVTLEQVTYFAVERAGPVRGGVMPLWIWMDDPSFYGFPSYGEPTVKAAQDCGGPAVDPDDRTSDPDPAMEALLAEHMRAMLPGVGRAGAVGALPVHPDARPGLRDRRRCRATSASWWGWAPRTASSSRRRSAGCWPTWPTTGATATDVTAFRLDRPALTEPDYAAALAGVRSCVRPNVAHVDAELRRARCGGHPAAQLRPRVTVR